MAGFVIIHRDIMEWEWYQSPTVSRLYFHLILRVNYTDKKWQGILVKRGQLITSNEHLAIELKLSIQTIRTAIQKLKKGKYIGVETTNRYTLITLCNYDKFQSAPSVFNKQSANQKTIKKLLNNKSLTPTKQSNKEKKINNKTIEERRIKFKNDVFVHSQFKLEILESFFDYWSELNISKIEMRFETEHFFEVEKRLKKWLANERPKKVITNPKPELQTNR